MDGGLVSLGLVVGGLVFFGVGFIVGSPPGLETVGCKVGDHVGDRVGRSVGERVLRRDQIVTE